MTRTPHIALLLLASSSVCHAQGVTPSDIQKEHYARTCTSMYNGAVKGTEDLSLIASETVMARIAGGAGGKGAAQAMQGIGDANALGISDVVHLSYGDVFVCQFRHAKGSSVWSLAYSPLSHTVEDIAINVVPDNQQEPAPAPKKPAVEKPATPEPDTGRSTPAAPASTPPTPTQSQACEMFPDLC